MRILEEFWYGNIEPTEYDSDACKEYKETLRLISRNEEKLLAAMTDEQKNCFPATQTPSVSIRPLRSACCSRTALGWVPR